MVRYRFVITEKQEKKINIYDVGSPKTRKTPVLEIIWILFRVWGEGSFYSFVCTRVLNRILKFYKSLGVFLVILGPILGTMIVNQMILTSSWDSFIIHI